jgi:Uma2 family endonuclease
MNTTTAPGVAPGPQTPTLIDIVKYLRPGQRLAVTEVSWEDYERLLEWRDDYRRTVRLTYDRGRLEIMVLSNLHERLRKVLAMLVEAWISESGGNFVPSGQLTHLRKDLERGFEPDECYYVQNWSKVAGLRELDFAKDPPPDLTIENEVSRSVLSRLPVFAAFKIPEVWRYDSERITILLLQANGEYRESVASLAIPNFPFAEAARHLAMASDVSLGFGDIDRRFRQWIRSLPGGASAPNT